jgi:phosphoserine phosphatase RsbU/P
MDEQLNYAPCGFITLTKEGIILSINKTLLQILNHSSSNLIGQHVQTIFTSSSRIFFQLYFIPLISVKHRIEEMFLTLASNNDDEIPVLINASLYEDKEQPVITCIIIPMHRRNEYEEQLLIAKKRAEDAFEEKNKAIVDLKVALDKLEDKQEELLKVNQQNLKYKIDTEKELLLAKKIQETALTRDISNERIRIESYYNASKALSGDIYGCYQINHNQYRIILLDVMGHGISSALITMSLQSLFHRLITQAVEADIVMQELDNHLHNLFQDSKDAWHYCTAIYLNIDTNKKTLEYINAGHPPAIYQDPSGQQEELFSTNPPLGTFKNIKFKSKKITYVTGGRILLYTDGVSESLEPDSLNQILQDHASLSFSTVKEKITYLLKNNIVESNRNDDQCFIFIEMI